VKALENGVATVITSGYGYNPITAIVAGKKLGTMFAKTLGYDGPPVEELASKSTHIVLLIDEKNSFSNLSP
jgi:hypothetical protein